MIRAIAVGLWTTVLLVGLTACIGCGAGEPVARINCGAEKDYVDADGVKWAADQVLEGEAKWGAINGLTVVRTGMTIPSSKRPDLYLRERYSMKGYEFSLPNGTYTLRLHFAETFDQHSKAGQRIFSVKVNGQMKLEDLDVLKEAGGFAKPLVKELPGIAVTDGKLKIEFVQKVQNPEINAIEILK